MGFPAQRHIRLSAIESIGLHPYGTEIALDSGATFVTTNGIEQVIKIVELALIKEETLI